MKNKNKKQYTFAEAVLFLYGTGLVAVWSVFLIISTLAFLFKVSLSPVPLWLSLLLSSSLLLYITGKITDRNKLAIYTSSLILLLSTSVAAISISGNIYDLSFDGQAYHQEALIQLSRGWNPVYTRLDGQATANLERWLNHYPKGHWLIAASIYDMTGNIESGKFLSILSPFIALVFGWWSLWRIKIKKLFKFLLVVCLVINPVVIYQSLSFYIDGILVSILLSLAFIGLRMLISRDRLALWPYLFSLIILVNLKLSAIVFALIFVFALIMILWTKNLLYFSLKTIKVSLLSFLVGVLFVGYNPYVTNFVIEGHPLYPAMGKRAIDYLPTNMPENYISKSAPMRLMSSIFAKSSLERGGGSSVGTKNLFGFSKEETEAFRETSVKTGGFGPLFGLITALSVLFIFLYLIFSDNRKTKPLFVIVLLVILSTAGAVSMSSVARFVPFVWWIPGLVIGALFVSNKSWMHLCGLVMTLLCVLNLTVIATAYYPYNIRESAIVRTKLQDIANQKSDKPINIYVAQFGSVKIKLNKFGIYYQELPNTIDCIKKSRLLPHNITEVCETPTP